MLPFTNVLHFNSLPTGQVLLFSLAGNGFPLLDGHLIPDGHRQLGNFPLKS